MRWPVARLNDLMVPGMIDCDMTDFMIDYMLRGTSEDELMFGHVSSLGCKSIQETGSGCHLSVFGKHKTLTKNEIIFMPILVNDVQWVLVVLVHIHEDTMFLGKEKNKCVLCFDPNQNHGENAWSVDVTSSEQQKSIHQNLLKWLNNSTTTKHTEDNLPLIPVFDKRHTCKNNAEVFSSIPTQNERDVWNSGVYVLHYVHAISVNYTLWRSKLIFNGPFVDSIYHQKSAFRRNEKPQEFAATWRHQVAALMVTLDKLCTSR